MVLLMAVATLLHIWSGQTHGFSERCRRVSARGYAIGRELGASQHSELLAHAPPFTAAPKLPAATIDEYYEPTKPQGPPRLREIYAHSSFYSWRLLRREARLLLVLGLVLAIVGGVVVYGLALSSSPDLPVARILDIVCTLVLTVLAAKALMAAAAAHIAARGAKTVADGLLHTKNQELVEELIETYNVDRASGPSISTLNYKRARSALQAEWHQRREALDELE